MTADHCNNRKLSAKNVSETSNLMFLSMLIRSAGPLSVEGLVTQVMDRSMDCVLSNMGIVKRVYVNRNEEIESFDYSGHGGALVLSVKWKGTAPCCQTIQMFSSVQLSLEPHDKNPFEFSARLLKPMS